MYVGALPWFRDGDCRRRRLLSRLQPDDGHKQRRRFQVKETTFVKHFNVELNNVEDFR